MRLLSQERTHGSWDTPLLKESPRRHLTVARSRLCSENSSLG
uniref:Uncharacterized protein n=1 Tax=Anguilla anguilla TaxID=7936 RepID=A0A0E9U181_ANGAN